ncbi:uncharacterized protein SCHCODRAFT_01347853 [Schizophyllum commune H4-8]|nr:uncharacterized protein SCHCODRAFT_01347853 [Schizophyllum commune H4-8]KAI5894604.1 hypothetical protein SCHCODRAFT_01347853 [Schizophyllum commune H4-8]
MNDAPGSLTTPQTTHSALYDAIAGYGTYPPLPPAPTMGPDTSPIHTRDTGKDSRRSISPLTGLGAYLQIAEYPRAAFTVPYEPLRRTNFRNLMRAGGGLGAFALTPLSSPWREQWSNPIFASPTTAQHVNTTAYTCRVIAGALGRDGNDADKKTIYIVLRLVRHRAERSHKPSALPRRTPRARHPLPGDEAEDRMCAPRAPPPNLPTFRWAGLGRGPPRSDPEIYDAGLEVWAALDAALGRSRSIKGRIVDRLTQHSNPFLLFSYPPLPHLPSQSDIVTSRAVSYSLLVLLEYIPSYRTTCRRLARAYRAITPAPTIRDGHLSLAAMDADVVVSILLASTRMQKAHRWKSVYSATRNSRPLHCASGTRIAEETLRRRSGRSGSLHDLRRHRGTHILTLHALLKTTRRTLGRHPSALGIDGERTTRVTTSRPSPTATSTRRPGSTLAVTDPSDSGHLHPPPSV